MKESRLNKEFSEMWKDKNYGKSRTDKTHFKPNVNVWNDLQGATNKVGVYDEDIETGKIREFLSNPGLDIAEKMEVAKKYTESTNAEIKDFVNDFIANENITNTTNEETTKTVSE